MHTLIIGSAAYLFILMAWIRHHQRLAYANARMMPVIPASFYQMDAEAPRGPVDAFEYEATRG